MKTPLVIIIVVVVGILGLLVVYSQQHEMPVTQANAGGYGSSSHPSGGNGTATPASEEKGAAAKGQSADPAPAENGTATPASEEKGASGGHGSAPASGGYGK